jgi:hypothetical protein
MIPMTVGELITLLETFPKNMPVAYAIYSEHALLEKDDVKVKRLCKPRPDGWVHNIRSSKDTQEYLVFPGN